MLINIVCKCALKDKTVFRMYVQATYVSLKSESELKNQFRKEQILTEN